MATGAASLDCFRHHGGRIDAARLLFLEAPAEWIDLSTGISPRACPISGDAVAASRTLPGPGDLAALEQAAAISFGVADAAAVVAVPGTDLALRLLGVLLAVPRIAALVPGYGGHIAAWGERLVTPIAADDLEGAADTHDALILANPNNPDGRRFTRARLLDLADRLARGSAWLIVDEAFADARPDDSIASEAGGNVIVLRSFGKFFGLPGLRLGFVIGAPAITAPLRRLIGDWPLSSTAIHVATSAYRDGEWQAGQRRYLARSTERLDRLLISRGLKIVGGTPLFRLTHHPEADGLFVRLARASILTRPFAPDSGLLRFGLPRGKQQWQRLGAAMGQIAR